MRVERHGVFETNSSSTHSICISSDDCKWDTLTVEDDGICRIYPGEFGWEEEEYNDPATKASYCLTHAKQKDNKAHLEMLKDVIKEMTGAKEVEFVDLGGFYGWGYIDHQSDHVCDEAWESPEVLKNFIFNPKSILQTDNDNH